MAVDLDRLARFLSTAFSPAAVAVGGSVIIAAVYGIGWSAASQVTGLGIITVVLPLLTAREIAERHMGYDLSRKEDRPRFYLMSALLSAVYIAALRAADAPIAIMELVYAGIAAVLVGALVNYRTKASVHTGAVTGLAAMVSFRSPAAGLVLFMLAGAVAWSRVRLGRHTTRQVIYGGAVSAACVTTVLVSV
ncbi:MAG: hypothetical protein ABEJ91_00950 [Candidatus Nanohaloarchaea archaeon]